MCAKWVSTVTEHQDAMPRGSIPDLGTSRNSCILPKCPVASISGWDIPSLHDEVLALRGAPSSALHITRHTSFPVLSLAGATVYTLWEIEICRNRFKINYFLNNSKEKMSQIKALLIIPRFLFSSKGQKGLTLATLKGSYSRCSINGWIETKHTYYWSQFEALCQEVYKHPFI